MLFIREKLKIAPWFLAFPAISAAQKSAPSSFLGQENIVIFLPVSVYISSWRGENQQHLSELSPVAEGLSPSGSWVTWILCHYDTTT